MTKALHYLHISALAPEEHETGYYGRHAVTAKSTPGFKGWCYPSRIAERIKPFQSLIGTPEAILNGHTLYPLNKRVLHAEDAACVRSHLLDEPQHGLPALIGAGGPYGGWSTFRPAYCEECIREDIAPTGVPFWRRVHQQPGLLYCARHARPLLTPCLMCLPSNWTYIVPLPGRRCGCPAAPLVGRGALSDASVAIEIELASAASKLLDPSYLPQLDASAIGALVRLGAQRLGMPSRGDAQCKWWGAFLNQADLKASFERMNYQGIFWETVGALLRGSVVLRHPIRALLLLRGMWGSWDAVERAARDPGLLGHAMTPREPRSVVKVGQDSPRPHPKARHETGETALLAKYTHLRRLHPEASRSALLAQLPQPAYLLTQTQLRAADIEALGGIEALDGAMREHIFVRAEILTTTGHPERLTAKQLLEGHPMAGDWYRIRSMLPAATQAMRLCVETNGQYVARMRVWPYLAESGSADNEFTPNEDP